MKLGNDDVAFKVNDIILKWIDPSAIHGVVYNIVADNIWNRICSITYSGASVVERFFDDIA